MNSRFLQTIKISSFNSLIVNMIDLCFLIAYFSLNTELFVNKFYHYLKNNSSIFVFTYFNLPVWAIVYTFGSMILLLYFNCTNILSYLEEKFYQILIIIFNYEGLMDIFILYDRIHILYPKLKFLAKVSVYKISVVIFLFAFIINIPINLSRQAITVPFKIGSNTTTLLQTYGNILDD